MLKYLSFFPFVSIRWNSDVWDNVSDHLIKCFSTLLKDKENESVGKQKYFNHFIFNQCLLTNRYYTRQQLSKGTLSMSLRLNKKIMLKLKIQSLQHCLVTNNWKRFVHFFFSVLFVRPANWFFQFFSAFQTRFDVVRSIDEDSKNLDWEEKLDETRICKYSNELTK